MYFGGAASVSDRNRSVTFRSHGDLGAAITDAAQQDRDLHRMRAAAQPLVLHAAGEGAMSLGSFLGRMMQAAFPPLPNPFAPFGGGNAGA